MGIMEIKLYIIRFITPQNIDSGVFFIPFIHIFMKQTILLRMK